MVRTRDHVGFEEIETSFFVCISAMSSFNAKFSEMRSKHARSCCDHWRHGNKFVSEAPGKKQHIKRVAAIIEQPVLVLEHKFSRSFPNLLHKTNTF